ncbi:MAG: hypothetical protein ABUL62_20210 [Myxococcales bacterium]
MHTGLARLLIVASALRCLIGCSLPEASTAPGDGKAQSSKRDLEVAREQREIERRRQQQQNEVLSDLQKLREGRGGATQLARDDSSKSAQPKLLIFGGASHEVYLGCLCEGKNPESVFNLAGEFGSDLSLTSMRNKFAPYGSNHEDTSACNANATHPPSVVASDGKALGLLTMNAALKKRIAAASVTNWLAHMCRL